MNSKNESQKTIMLRAWRHYREITSRVLAATVGTIAILGIPAYFLDKWIGSFPLIFGIVLVLSLPISQFATIKLMQKYLKDNPQD
jgi:uncharacterized protein YneF (UPF0154 family)